MIPTSVMLITYAKKLILLSHILIVFIILKIDKLNFFFHFVLLLIVNHNLA